MKTLYVLGDCCTDRLIYDDDYIPPIETSGVCNWKNNGCVSMSVMPGGTLLLAHFLRTAMQDCKINTYDIDPESKADQLINSFSEVRSFKERMNGTDINRFRIKRFKGYCGPASGSPGPFPIQNIKNLDKADLIVLDDAGNGFRNDPNLWFNQLLKSKNKPVIIHKINYPLNDNILLNTITQQLPEKHIIIINAGDLRKNGVQIGSGLSWDRTITDFIHSYHTDARLKHFKKSSCLIVRFGMEAALFIRKVNTDRTGSGKICEDEMRLLFYPNKYEGELVSETPGSMQGLTCIFLTAMIQEIRNIADIASPDASTFIENGIIRGLDAVMICLQSGFSRNANGEFEYSVHACLETRETEVKTITLSSFLNYPGRGLSILDDRVCGGASAVQYGAMELVQSGKVRGSLTTVPFVKFGDMTSADHEEIESYRSIRALLEEYIGNTKMKKPISIGVFGPPGSGKSFGIKQIANMFGEQFSILEFNISQFNSTDELSRAFHEVRNVNLKGKIPLAFFDEFDASYQGQELGWLKYFLAPMQDGEFRDRDISHPLGRCVFVFAGGTSYTYESFEHPYAKLSATDAINDRSHEQLITERKKLKVPDFLSRLRGFINIKGINRSGSNPDDDAVFMIRRALVLRHLLSRLEGIFNRDTREISIDRDLLRALITLPNLKHGARSLEAIVGMSSLKGARIFSRSCLPADHLLKMHINVDPFKSEINMNNAYTLDQEFLNAYGKITHAFYVENEIQKGQTPETNTSIKPWEELSEHEKESNRQQGVDATLKLAAFDYSIRLKSANSKPFKGFTKQEIEKMAIMEHERWMIYKQKEGWRYAPGTKNNDNKTNPCLVSWSDLPEIEKDKDRLAVSRIPEILDKCGYEIYELPK